MDALGIATKSRGVLPFAPFPAFGQITVREQDLAGIPVPSRSAPGGVVVLRTIWAAADHTDLRGILDTKCFEKMQYRAIMGPVFGGGIPKMP